MRALKYICLFVFFSIFLTALCGCTPSYKSVEELMKPPYAAGEFSDIQKAFYKTAGEDTKLLTPANGEYTNSFVLFDADSDKEKEAFVFYSSNDSVAHVQVLKKADKEWKKVDDFQGYGTTVDFVKFVDMNNNGYPEIIIGWVIFDKDISKKIFSVHGYNSDSDSYQSMANESYTLVSAYDLDSDGKAEIISVVLNSDNDDSKSCARMYKILRDNTFALASECKLDSSVTSYSGMSFENSVIYLDASIGDLQTITEIISWDRESNSIINPFIDENFGTNRKTWRRVPVPLTDINNDKKIDVPVQSFELSNSSTSNIVDYDCITWMHYSNKELYKVKTSAVDLYGKYILHIPGTLENSVSLSYNKAEKSLTVLHNDYFGSYEIMKVYEFNINEWDSTEEKKYTLLKQTDESVFAYALTEYGYDLGITAKYIETNFKLINK